MPLKSALSREERKFFAKLHSPAKVQDYLDSLPINFEKDGETYMSPRRTIAAKTAHCFEGALVAAAAFALHGGRPLLMDLRTDESDEDHVVALFEIGGYWGAVSKTNHPVLRYRDAVYKSPRELALSYFHEYFDKRGKKTLREYSAPFSLVKYLPQRWLTAEDELFWLVDALDNSRHFPIAPKKNLKQLRSASKLEQIATAQTEWES